MSELYFECEREARKYKTLKILKHIAVYSLLVAFAIFTIVPFYWMINLSLSPNEVLLRPHATFFPSLNEITLENFVEILTGDGAQLLDFMLNTVIVAVFSVITSVVVTVMAAFAFARLNFKGKELLFAIFLSTMMIPGEMMILTNFMTVSRLGWIDTFTALIVPGMGSIFFTFFLRQTFKQIPNELYYAAKVDGNTDLRYLLKVMLPIAKPALITVVILSSIGTWNSYIWPRTVTRTNRMITDGMMFLFFDETGGNNANYVMAAAVVVSLPLLIVFLLFRKYIMRGVSRSGIKG